MSSIVNNLMNVFDIPPNIICHPKDYGKGDQLLWLRSLSWSTQHFDGQRETVCVVAVIKKLLGTGDIKYS